MQKKNRIQFILLKRYINCPQCQFNSITIQKDKFEINPKSFETFHWNEMKYRLNYSNKLLFLIQYSWKLFISSSFHIECFLQLFITFLLNAFFHFTNFELVSAQIENETQLESSNFHLPIKNCWKKQRAIYWRLRDHQIVPRRYTQTYHFSAHTTRQKNISNSNSIDSMESTIAINSFNWNMNIGWMGQFVGLVMNVNWSFTIHINVGTPIIIWSVNSQQTNKQW